MNDIERQECLLCPRRVDVEPGPEIILPGNLTRESEELIFTCKRCGRYRVPFGLVLRKGMIPSDLKPYLSAAARQAYEAGATILLDGDLEELAAAHRGVSVTKKVEKVLRSVARKCERPGHLGSFDIHEDFPIADCLDWSEFNQYLEYLEDERLIKVVYTGVGDDRLEMYAPTIKGWEAVEPTLPVGGEKDRCFVAMWFDDALDAVYSSGFEKAVEECGFRCYRIKEDPTNKGIVDKILAEIRRSRFVVADFTGHRTSVYYEAGFATGLGREVIGCCRADEVKNLTFDTRHLGHIVWKDAKDLRERLADSIRANIIPKR